MILYITNLHHGNNNTKAKLGGVIKTKNCNQVHLAPKNSQFDPKFWASRIIYYSKKVGMKLLFSFALQLRILVLVIILEHPQQNCACTPHTWMPCTHTNPPTHPHKSRCITILTSIREWMRYLLQQPVRELQSKDYHT